MRVKKEKEPVEWAGKATNSSSKTYGYFSVLTEFLLLLLIFFLSVVFPLQMWASHSTLFEKLPHDMLLSSMVHPHLTVDRLICHYSWNSLIQYFEEFKNQVSFCYVLKFLLTKSQNNELNKFSFKKIKCIYKFGIFMSARPIGWNCHIVEMLVTC